MWTAAVSSLVINALVFEKHHKRIANVSQIRTCLPGRQIQGFSNFQDVSLVLVAFFPVYFRFTSAYLQINPFFPALRILCCAGHKVLCPYIYCALSFYCRKWCAVNGVADSEISTFSSGGGNIKIYPRKKRENYPPVGKIFSIILARHFPKYLILNIRLFKKSRKLFHLCQMLIAITFY